MVDLISSTLKKWFNFLTSKSSIVIFSCFQKKLFKNFGDLQLLMSITSHKLSSLLNKQPVFGDFVSGWLLTIIIFVFQPKQRISLIWIFFAVSFLTFHCKVLPGRQAVDEFWRNSTIQNKNKKPKKTAFPDVSLHTSWVWVKP